MTDYFLAVAPQAIDWELRSNVAVFPPSSLGGVTRTAERFGARWAATWSWEAVFEQDAARLRSFLANQRGGANRFYAYPPAGTLRGSFSSTELLSNPQFASGTTGWTSSVYNTISVSEGVLRSTRDYGAGANSFALSRSSAVTGLTQYRPYAARFMVVPGRGSFSAGFSVYDNSQLTRISSAALGFGLLTGSTVAPTTSMTPNLLDDGTTVASPGDYLLVPFSSAARCALVDNGVNLLLRSDEFDNASWTKTASSVTANTATNPIGTNTGETLIEDSSTGFHFAQQSATVSSSAADYTFGVAIKAVSRNFAWLEMSDGTHTVIVYVNLANGALNTPTSSGANFTDPRAVTALLGNGWYAVYLTGRKASSSTTVTCRVGLATALGTGSYAGDGASSIAVWRGTLAQAGVPTRLAATTTTANSGSSQTGGGLHVRGLPASTAGLLLPGDWVEIITPTYSELKRVIAALNSDAAGLGYLQFEPILRQSPVNSAAVIVTKPMGRFMLDESTVKWSHRPGGIHSLSFTAVEDIAA